MVENDNPSSTNKRRCRQPNHVAFRLLCHVSKSGAVIGKSGSIVKLIEQETGARIQMDEVIHGCQERVIHIFSSELPKKTITLKKDFKGEENEVTSAQHGLIRVLERVLEVFPTINNCRLLADTSQIGYMIGKSGSRIKSIEKDIGARIRVCVERCPTCALPNDELIEITGDSLAVKKATLAISQCLQDSPPLDRAQMAGSNSFMAAADGSFSYRHAEFLSHPTFLPPTGSSFADNASRNCSNKKPEEVAFKLLCSNERIGGVIGKKGTIIRALQNETGASIHIEAPVAESDDRVITISALENVESQYSPAQNAVVRIFTRSIEVGIENGLESGENKDQTVEARLLVASNQVGCLIGKGGKIVSEMRKITATGMWILQDDRVPKCATENESVFQITGNTENVQNALFIVTARLRDNLFPNNVMNMAGRVREPTSSGSYQSDLFGRQVTLTEHMQRLRLTDHLDQSISPKLQKSRMMSKDYSRGTMDNGRGIARRTGLECGSGSKSAVVTNSTLEIVVSEDVIGSVIGENESNLNRLREISGAKVIWHEPFPGTNEATVIISGTPDQTQAAQSLLHAFLLGG
ncbi:hypothetical protein IFM89_034681 [Coptis chinensis]|uniref:K Homology domain-containing protein n=1 Tax=Coptis chinensis TaxID=261450 RepID=A0A835HRY1_9MAGN|nr:hypothetical protein IFM89_034681 [Coptis chinensis]